MGQFVPQIEALAKQQLRELTPFRVGDTVHVHYRITEGDKERIQVFQGTVIRKSGGGLGRTFCVRKRSGGVGVERVFPYSLAAHREARGREPAAACAARACTTCASCRARPPVCASTREGEQPPAAEPPPPRRASRAEA